MSRLNRSSLIDRGAAGDDVEFDPQFVSAVARGMALLEAFDVSSEQLGNAEIAKRIGVPKATASRIAYTLVKLGYLKLDPFNQKYRLGPRVVALSRHYMGSRGAIEMLSPILREFAERYRSAVALTERDGLTMTYVDYHRSEGAVVVARAVGSRAPLDRSAAGRAYLATTTERDRDHVIARLAARGDDIRGLGRIVDQARANILTNGFVSSYGDWTEHVNAVAAPFRAPVDGTLMVVSIAAPDFVVSAEKFDTDVGPALVSALKAAGLP